MEKVDPYRISERAVAKLNRAAMGPMSRLVPAANNLPFLNHTAELRYAGFGKQREAQQHHA